MLPIGQILICGKIIIMENEPISFDFIESPEEAEELYDGWMADLLQDYTTKLETLQRDYLEKLHELQAWYQQQAKRFEGRKMALLRSIDPSQAIATDNIASIIYADITIGYDETPDWQTVSLGDDSGTVSTLVCPFYSAMWTSTDTPMLHFSDNQGGNFVRSYVPLWFYNFVRQKANYKWSWWGLVKLHKLLNWLSQKQGLIMSNKLKLFAISIILLSLITIPSSVHKESNPPNRLLILDSDSEANVMAPSSDAVTKPNPVRFMQVIIKKDTD